MAKRKSSEKPHSNLIIEAIEYIDKKEYAIAISILEELVKKNDAEAQYTLALLLENEEGIESSEERSNDLFKLSADQGHIGSLLVLASKYEFGKGIVEKSEEKAVELYKIAANKGDGLANYYLGCMYYGGKGVERSYEEAARLFRIAATKGVAEAQYCLGCMYRDGKGVKPSKRWAFKYFTDASKQNNACAQYCLGCMYRDGEFVEISYETAASLFKKSSDQGNTDATMNLMWMYLSGDGVDESIEEALNCWKIAIRKNNLIAQELLVKYINSNRDPNKDIKIFDFFEAAAMEGDANAQNFVGYLCYRGIGTEESEEKAIMWFTKSAEQGNIKAQYNLGLYYQSKGDVQEAIKWYTEAANRGDEESVKKLDELKK